MPLVPPDRIPMAGAMLNAHKRFSAVKDRCAANQSLGSYPLMALMIKTSELTVLFNECWDSLRPMIMHKVTIEPALRLAGHGAFGETESQPIKVTSQGDFHLLAQPNMAKMEKLTVHAQQPALILKAPEPGELKGLSRSHTLQAVPWAQMVELMVGLGGNITHTRLEESKDTGGLTCIPTLFEQVGHHQYPQLDLNHLNGDATVWVQPSVLSALQKHNKQAADKPAPRSGAKATKAKQTLFKVLRHVELYLCPRFPLQAVQALMASPASLDTKGCPMYTAYFDGTTEWMPPDLGAYISEEYARMQEEEEAKSEESDSEVEEQVAEQEEPETTDEASEAEDVEDERKAVGTRGKGLMSPSKRKQPDGEEEEEGPDKKKARTE